MENTEQNTGGGDLNVNPACNDCSSSVIGTLIVSNVKSKNFPLREKNEENEEDKPTNRGKESYDNADEIKSVKEEEYNKERNEQIYKQLMHLLSKSKFYSNYLLEKIEKSMEKEEVTKKRAKRHANKENIQSSKKKQNRANLNKYNIQEYMREDIKKQAQNKKRKMDLSLEEIEAELTTDSDSETETPINTSIVTIPKYFHGDLYDYQQKGLQWLKVLYENGLNGILADEMGLGKTIQVIALFCHLIEKEQTGPYLIIAPLSILSNWQQEFKRFAPDIPVVTYHGNKAEKLASYLEVNIKYRIGNGYKTQPVVLTTFEMPIREIKFFRSQKWRYIVIDEGQRIKNHKCMLMQILKTVQSTNRLILTGTPLQNNLAELWSLLNFLLPEIFDNLAVFESWFDVTKCREEATEILLKQEEDKQVLMILRNILKPFMLRREKDDVGLEIPPKKQVIVYTPLTKLQLDLYKAALTYNIKELNKITESRNIISTVDGKRPKRQCVSRCMYGNNENILQNEISSSDTSLQKTKISGIADWKTMKVKDQDILLMWKQHINVTNNNKNFLINMHIPTSNKVSLYKKIVNHPYLVYHPLGRNGLLKIDEDLVKSSGKLLVLDAMLAKLKTQDHKVLLFSTMTMILDMLENYLLLRDYKYVRLDGRTDIDIRTENVYNFNRNSDLFLFLISTRAGGIGLNLAGADTVIIYDSDWNPQVDIQAMARCHRIGQTKPVVIYRLCTKGTIDEIIIKRSDTKRILERAIMSKNWSANRKECLLQLAELIKSKEYEIITSTEKVFTEAELNKLLDRSDMLDGTM